MSIEEAFRADIAANQGDSFPGWLYADWLEEAGRPLEAAFVRVCLETGLTPVHCPGGPLLWWGEQEERFYGPEMAYYRPWTVRVWRWVPRSIAHDEPCC